MVSSLSFSYSMRACKTYNACNLHPDDVQWQLLLRADEFKPDSEEEEEAESEDDDDDSDVDEDDDEDEDEEEYSEEDEEEEGMSWEELEKEAIRCCLVPL